MTSILLTVVYLDMKIVPQDKLSYKAGLTKQFNKEIQTCNTSQISSYLARNNIKTNFQDNKVIAWCSLQCFEIFKKLKLPLPKGIFVDKFSKFRNIDTEAIGFTTMTPSFLLKDNDTIVEEKNIFFNSEEAWYWNNIDEVSDEGFYTNVFPSDFFLTTFFHEFSHVVHEEHLLNKLGGEKVVTLIKKVLKSQHKDCSPQIYSLFSEICRYATASPFEAIACDFSKRLAECIEIDELKPKLNFIKESPYREKTLKEKFLGIKFKSEKDKLLHQFWNGKAFEEFYL